MKYIMTSRFGEARRTYSPNQSVNRWSIPRFKNIVVNDSWHDMVVSPLTLKSGGLQAPDVIKRRDDGAGSVGIYMLSFSHNQSSHVFFQQQLTHDYQEGSDIHFHFHFGVPTNAVGNIHFQCEFIWDNVGPPGVQLSTVQDLVVAAPAAKIHTISSFPVWSGAGKRISSIISGRFSRIIDASDTYVDTATLLSLDWHYLSNSFGSTELFSKGIS